MDGRMNRDEADSAFGFDGDLIEIFGGSRRMQLNFNRLNNFVNDFALAPKPEGDEVTAAVGGFKYQLLQRRVGGDFDFDAVRADDFQFNGGHRRAFGNALAKNRPVVTVYFVDHNFFGL